MRNIFVIFIVFINVFLLTSCRIASDDGYRKVDKQMTLVFNTLKNKDKEGLKKIFSKQALSKISNFDKATEDFFDYVKGDIESWKSEGHGYEDELNSTNYTREIHNIYFLKTTQQEYTIVIYSITDDSGNPDNIGIYSLCIVSEEDNKDSEHQYWGNGEIGINIGY